MALPKSRRGPTRLGNSPMIWRDLLDFLGWPSATIAGASMGGVVALGFAAQFPGRMDGLGLIDTTAWYGDNAAGQWSERAERALQEGLTDLVDFQTTRWFTDRFREENPGIVRRSVESFLRNDPNAYAATCRMLGNFDLRPTLKAIACPAAVVVGREDYATPVEMAEQLHLNISGSSLTIIEDGRHLTPLEHPRIIAEEIRRVLDRRRS